MRFVAISLFIIGFLIAIVLNPNWAYANKTSYKNYDVYHNKPLDPGWLDKLDEATELIKTSELYNPDLRLDICLNDGAFYPSVIKTIQGQAFAWGFYDKVVFHARTEKNYAHVELNGYTWNLTQLLAHEMVHCLQFDRFGPWKSKPIANIPNWKWEGYAEYISRKNDDQKNLVQNISRLYQTNEDAWAILFNDGTIAPREYYSYWMLVQYCIDIKKMGYDEILDDNITEEILGREMTDWYQMQTKTDSEINENLH